MKRRIVLLILFVCGGILQEVHAQSREVIAERMEYIGRVLDSAFFVSRFESVETPCLCIDEQDSSVAYPKREVINSDYKLQLAKKNKFDSTGIKCLSEHVARYMKFRVSSINIDSQVISGTVETTYAYPASSLIQFLGATHALADKGNRFFGKLIKLHGRFRLYPANEKFRIQLVLTDPPYDEGDAYFGYLEIVQDAFRERPETVFLLNFDLMSIEKGDKNNKIGEGFTSTSHAHEMQYYTVLAYHVLKYAGSTDVWLKANAIWLDNFLKNPECPSCKPVYTAAKYMVAHGTGKLPNTSPVPAH